MKTITRNQFAFLLWANVNQPLDPRTTRRIERIRTVNRVTTISPADAIVFNGLLDLYKEKYLECINT